MKLKGRKVLVLLLCLVMAVGMFSGCKSTEPAKDPAKPAEAPAAKPAEAPAKAEPVKLVFWTMWDGGDVAVAKKVFDEYNKSNKSNVTIDFQQQDNAQYYTKLKTSILGGTGPDFAVAHVGGFVTGMAADGNILPLDEAATKANVKLEFDKYSASAVESSKVGGKIYSVPLDNLVRVLMYNKAILKDTGLLDKDGNLVMDKGIAGFNKVMDTVKEKKPDIKPLVLTMRPPQLVLGWLTMYAQMGGGNIVDLTTKKAVFDEALGVKALNAYKEIYSKYVPPKIAPPADFDMFKTGKAAFYIDGAWMVSSSAEVLGKDFGVAKFPQLYDKDLQVTTNHGFILPVKKSRTDAQTKAVMEFMKWWADNNSKWCEAGHLPGYVPTQDTAEFKNLPYHKFYQETLKGAVAIPILPNTNFHQAPEVTGPIQKAMLGDMKTEDAIKEVKKNLDALIAKLVN